MFAFGAVGLLPLALEELGFYRNIVDMLCVDVFLQQILAFCSKAAVNPETHGTDVSLYVVVAMAHRVGQLDALGTGAFIDLRQVPLLPRSGTTGGSVLVIDISCSRTNSGGGGGGGALIIGSAVERKDYPLTLYIFVSIALSYLRR